MTAAWPGTSMVIELTPQNHNSIEIDFAMKSKSQEMTLAQVISYSSTHFLAGSDRIFVLVR